MSITAFVCIIISLAVLSQVYTIVSITSFVCSIISLAVLSQVYTIVSITSFVCSIISLAVPSSHGKSFLVLLMHGTYDLNFPLNILWSPRGGR